MTASSSISLTLEQYEALIALARKSAVNADGSVDQQQTLVIDGFLKQIEQDNGITRYSLFIRWQDPNAPLPAGVRFPGTWPPTLQFFLQLLSRPIAKSDVLTVVQAKTPNAQNIMVTPDVAGLVGWSKLDDYFVNP
jgi:hypothetical protein